MRCAHTWVGSKWSGGQGGTPDNGRPGYCPCPSARWQPAPGHVELQPTANLLNCSLPLACPAAALQACWGSRPRTCSTASCPTSSRSSTSASATTARWVGRRGQGRQRGRRGGVSGTGVRVQQGGWSGAGQGPGRGMQAGGRSAAPRQQRGVQSGVHRAASRSRTVLRARTCCCSALPLAC
jgi:hypothetical protein